VKVDVRVSVSPKRCTKVTVNPARGSRVGAAVGLGLASLLVSLAVSELLYRAVVQRRYERQVASFSAEPWLFSCREAR
jgi:hypothetical protein